MSWLPVAQVASEWLFSCPDAKLDRLLHGSGPATPAGEEADDAPVLAPRRVTTLQVNHVEISCMECSAGLHVPQRFWCPGNFLQALSSQRSSLHTSTQEGTV